MRLRLGITSSAWNHPASPIFTSLYRHASMEPRRNEVERTYENAIRILNGRQRRQRPKQDNIKPTGIEDDAKASSTPNLRGSPGIAGMGAWLQLLGHSEADLNRLNCIHVAGTKGKGSTCAFIESFLRCHGRRTGFPRKTGLYTSPHLTVQEERFRINSKPLSRELFAKYFFEIYDRLPQLAGENDASTDVAERGPRYLQLLALMAFHTFIRERVDVTILETHAGGEYDATNIVKKPQVTVVTTLGMDHIDMLGPTIENIAWHKAGIFKSGAAALSAVQDAVATKVLIQRSAEKSVDLQFIDVVDGLPQGSSSLRPEVQRKNASLAAAAAQAFVDRCGPEHSTLTSEDLASAVSRFSWPGRFQTISEGKWMWCLDSAHNEMSVQVAAQWFAELATGFRRDREGDILCILIFSHINAMRDAVALLASLADALKANDVDVSHVIFTTYSESEMRKGENSETKIELFRQAWTAIDPRTCLLAESTIQGAIARARRLGPDGMLTLITGSQYLVGPALRVLQFRNGDVSCDGAA